MEYLSENHKVKDGDKVYTSGKEGIFTPGIAVGEAKTKKENIQVKLYSDLNQMTFVNINFGNLENNEE